MCSVLLIISERGGASGAPPRPPARSAGVNPASLAALVSRLGDMQRLADHQGAGENEQEREWVQVEGRDRPHAAEHRLADAPGAREGHEERDEEDAGGYRSPLEVRDLARLRGHRFR